jgi:hypothetical protein
MNTSRDVDYYDEFEEHTPTQIADDCAKAMLHDYPGLFVNPQKELTKQSDTQKLLNAVLASVSKNDRLLTDKALGQKMVAGNRKEPTQAINGVVSKKISKTQTKKTEYKDTRVVSSEVTRDGGVVINSESEA